MKNRQICEDIIEAVVSDKFIPPINIEYVREVVKKLKTSPEYLELIKAVSDVTAIDDGVLDEQTIDMITSGDEDDVEFMLQALTPDTLIVAMKQLNKVITKLFNSL